MSLPPYKLILVNFSLVCNFFLDVLSPFLCFIFGAFDKKPTHVLPNVKNTSFRMAGTIQGLFENYHDAAFFGVENYLPLPGQPSQGKT
jgi:hypothetical protein